MYEFLVFHNDLDKLSRDFVVGIDTEKYLVLDWYKNNDFAMAKLTQLGISQGPSAFPTVLHIPTGKTFVQPNSIAESEEFFEDYLSTDKDLIFKAALAEGFPVSGRDFSLSLSPEDQNEFSKLLALLNEGLSLGHLTAQSVITIKDRNNILREITVGDYKSAMFSYGMYYKSLWDAKNSA